MKPLILAAAMALTAHGLIAADFSFAFEGNETLRERLVELQGSTKAPALQLSDWTNSEALSLADLRGKIVVLDFWAIWCGPCIRSIPHANSIHTKYKDKVVFIGICHPKGAEKMKEMVKDKGILYPVAIDEGGKMGKAYRVNGYPDYFIFDQKGTLVVADCANGKVDAVIEALLAK